MKVTTYINSIHELSLAHDNGIDEIILGHKDFSRLGTLDDDGFERLAKESNLLGIKPVFEWDILMTDDVFNKVIKKLNNLDLKNIEIFRVQDPGALNYVFENFSNTIQLILENGNHNFVGLRQWKDFLGSRLDRLVLSIEIPKDKLTEYITKLDCPIEILGLGRILLFYSPRNLLSPLVSDKRDFIYAEGESEESPHKGFPIIENKHGTFMFHIKNIFLLENLIELNQMKLSHLRIDLRDTDFLQLSHICNLVKDYSIEASKKFKETYSKDVIRGYFSVNKSDVLFKKLKNWRIQRKDENFLGSVLEVSKANNYMALNLVNPKKPLKVGDSIKIILPEGQEKFSTVKWIKNSNMVQIDSACSSLVVISHVNTVVAKSVVYLA